MRIMLQKKSLKPILNMLKVNKRIYFKKNSKKNFLI